MQVRFLLLLTALFLTTPACNKRVNSHGTPSSNSSEEKIVSGKNLMEDAVIVAVQNTEGPHAFVRDEATQEWRVLSEEEHSSFINSNLLLLQLKVNALLAKLSKETEDLQNPALSEDSLQKILSDFSKSREQLENTFMEYKTKALARITPNGENADKSQTLSWVIYGDKNSDPKKTARVFSIDEIKGTYMRVQLQLEMSLELLNLKQNNNANEEDKARFETTIATIIKSLQEETKIAQESKDELLTDFVTTSPWISKK